ncbi:hypothetical protein C7H19_07175 [Aphanothece hegewaldii CCALA 016]|uniref:CopG family transcriptional regulator n=1 Tax=Aphanothece hegewaldii CCALA 016 TaxID=2107694 RepID=A0A2T1M0Q1_9CHRO|nr:hypothetical protein [Aphanothece hegewaldii]PSF38243.1 hypothetical protein C7H19_07175 [Aphanothece hegewaldii CCALA 016]
MSKEEIIIQVPSNIAQAYRNFTEVEREQIEAKITDLLELQLENRRKAAIEKLRNTMKKASQEAKARGLTPEILESILNDEA